LTTTLAIMARARNQETDDISKKLAQSKRRSEQLKQQGYTEDQIESLQSAKLRKELATIAKLEFQLEILKRNYIPRTEALQYGMELADIVMQWAGEAMTNYPTSHAGKDEKGVREVLEPEIRDMVERFRAKAQSL
jgi:hypothetical protein